MAGPAKSAAARPVSTKIPVPIMQPMPSEIRLSEFRLRLSSLDVVLGVHLLDGFAQEQAREPANRLSHCSWRDIVGHFYSLRNLYPVDYICYFDFY